MRKPPRLLPAFTFAMFLVLAGQARAENITSGFLTTTQSGTQIYTFAGTNFTMSGAAGDFGRVDAYNNPHVVGSPISLRSRFVGSSLGRGSATVGDISYTNVFFAGITDFFGSAIAQPVSTSAPFTFQGTLMGYADSPRTQLLFTLSLSGQGLALLQTSAIIPDTNAVSVLGVRYDFQPVAVIPEPATLLLLGTGLAGVVAKVRNKRKANKSERV